MNSLLTIINLDFFHSLLVVKKYNIYGDLIGIKLDLPFKDNLFKHNRIDKRLKLKEALCDKNIDIKIVSLNIDEKFLKTINLYYKAKFSQGSTS